MTTFRKIALIAAMAGSLGLAAAVSAQPAPMNGAPCGAPNCPQMMKGNPHHWQGAPEARRFHHFKRGPRMSFEDRQALLLGKLDLSDAQKPAWKAYSEALTAAHKRPAKKERLGPDATYEQRLQARIDRLEARLQATKAIQDARTKLLAVLTPEQTQVFKDFEMRAHKRPAFRGPRDGRGPRGFGPEGRRFGPDGRPGFGPGYGPGRGPRGFDNEPPAPAPEGGAPEAPAKM